MRRHYYQRDDITIAYIRVGEPTSSKVVLLHGMAETSESCWEAQLESLAERFDCYAVDLRGHGESSVGKADGTLEQLGTDLLGFLADVSGPAAVVGFSMGGTIALWAASQQPATVVHVVAVGASSVISRGTAEFFRTKAETVEQRRLSQLHAEMLDEVGAMFVSSPERATEYGHRRVAAVGEGDGYANAARAMARMREHPLQPLLADVSCAIDIVGGEHDQWCPRKASEIILDGLTHGKARFHEIGGAGHLMSVDTPDELTHLLLDLLADSPASRRTHSESAS